jgi:hypothetical protein
VAKVRTAGRILVDTIFGEEGNHIVKAHTIKGVNKLVGEVN